ncbi:CaiB/BaiF CoA-transferase family protein [Bacteroidales bacterium]
MVQPNGKGILSGIKVLEFASVLAGPGVGAALAELGASVVKVENLSTKGDTTRSWKLPTEDQNSDFSAYFSCANWGKRSLAIDLKKPEALDLIYQIVAKTDIVIASYKPGDAEKLKVDYTSLRAIQPSLIYAHLTGYGLENDRAGYDAILQAEAGFTFINGKPGSKPTKMPVALIDILAGHQMKEAILLALLKKERTGAGNYVEVSLFRSALSSLANQATNWLVANTIPQATGSDHPNIVPYGTLFYTSDQKLIVLAVGTDKQFKNLCEILDIEHIAADKHFSDNPSRVKHRSALNEILKVQIAKVERDDLLHRLHRQKVPAGGVFNMQEVFEQHEAQPMLLSAKDNAGKTLKGVSSLAFQMKDATFGVELMRPPHLGEHSIEILKEFTHLTNQQIETLLNTQTIYDRSFTETDGLY